MEAKNVFQTGKVKTSMIKYTYRFNHYGLREAIINNNIVESIYLQCKKVELQDYMIKCQNTIDLRRKFIKEIVIELVRNKPEEVHIE